MQHQVAGGVVAEDPRRLPERAQHAVHEPSQPRVRLETAAEQERPLGGAGVLVHLGPGAGGATQHAVPLVRGGDQESPADALGRRPARGVGLVSGVGPASGSGSGIGISGGGGGDLTVCDQRARAGLEATPEEREVLPVQRGERTGLQELLDTGQIGVRGETGGAHERASFGKAGDSRCQASSSASDQASAAVSCPMSPASSCRVSAAASSGASSSARCSSIQRA